MYPDSFATFPAAALYDEQALASQKAIIDKCHIYMIGLVPIARLDGLKMEGHDLKAAISVAGQGHILTWQMPDGWTLEQEEGAYHLQSPEGGKYEFKNEELFKALRQSGINVNFDVQYIGQAYGDEGSRTAFERLKKHETLQKISLEGVKAGYRLEVLLLEPVAGNRVITLFNPKAENKADGADRIAAGLDKLFDTTEKERISLYEAALIRYFKPPYNSKFKDSFPSTNMKLLKECYDKDFAAVIAEVGFDELPYELCSDSVEAKHKHFATHDLHDDASRQVFFSKVT
ncbi:hypothetical protein CIW50_27815 [Tardiphaga sp. P9-11]|nr:hypothetical protein CIW50_27815 [Tardiphaga sp. P9-11]